LQRQRAQILLALDRANAGEAEALLKRSMEVARGQCARSLELRAATTLAELWHGQGKDDDARAVLGPICRWFEEGAETVDLRRARDIQALLH
jgi:hypothetical protein